MVRCNSDWAAFIVMASLAWLYSRWLWVTEPARQRRQARATMMENTYSHLEAAPFGTLQSLLSDEIRELREGTRRFRAILVLTLAVQAVAFVAISRLAAQESVRLSLMLLVAWASIPMLFVQVEAMRMSRKRIHDVTARMHGSPMRDSVGTLIEAMMVGDTASANLARLAVIAILPQLGPQDAHLLSGKHRAYLHRQLRGSNSDFILAILHALGQVGDSTAIPYVKRLVPCPVWLFHQEAIEQTASRCLSELRNRKRRQEATDKLLRPTSAAYSRTDMLLRPAREETRVGRELLRASASSKSGTRESAGGIVEARCTGDERSEPRCVSAGRP